jgi:hypothetical protein
VLPPGNSWPIVHHACRSPQLIEQPKQVPTGMNWADAAAVGVPVEFVGIFSVCAAQPAIVTMEPMSKIAARIPPRFLVFIRPLAIQGPHRKLQI